MALKLRQLIFWPHLIAGVTAGAVILTMSVTGVLLAFEKQIIAWADQRSITGSLAAGSRLSPESLLARVRAAEPERHHRSHASVGRARRCARDLRAQPDGPRRSVERRDPRRGCAQCAGVLPVRDRCPSLAGVGRRPSFDGPRDHRLGQPHLSIHRLQPPLGGDVSSACEGGAQPVRHRHRLTSQP